MFSALLCFLPIRPPSPSLPIPAAPPNTLEVEEDSGNEWDNWRSSPWDIMEQSHMLVRLYTLADQQQREEDEEQLAWLTEHYGTLGERFLMRFRARAGLNKPH